jgi:hypothetical protein
VKIAAKPAGTARADEASPKTTVDNPRTTVALGLHFVHFSTGAAQCCLTTVQS